MKIYNKTHNESIKIRDNGEELILVKEELKISKYISEKKGEIFGFINKHHRVLLAANPSSGKTALFADLCVQHIKENKAGRIVFCCPFLIIQEQFKERIELNNVKIDFELNHKANRKKLIETDRIITSTFHSLKHISNQLNNKDLIIVDEAHALLFTYTNQENKKRTFFTEFFQCLYKTKAKLVLMTGTPHDSLVELLYLSELKINHKNVFSKINIQYSNEKDVNLVLTFAENCLNKFGRDYLSVVYIKNKKKCHLFKDLIETRLNCKVVVLTSDEKDTEAYKTLIKKSIIPKEYQFLVTTNVISTGTNILNDKIGRALMLNEFDPSEIKQFSKRFRKKLDIEVDVINPKYKEPYYNPQEERADWINQRDQFRIIYKDLITTLSKINIEKADYVEFDSSYYDKYEGSPNHMIDLCLERFLIQETYFKNEITETYNTPIELSEALNDFNDILSVEINTYNDTYTDTDLGEKIITDKQIDVLNNLIDNFIQKPKQYLRAFHEYLVKTRNQYWKYKLENTININFQNENEKLNKGYNTITNILYLNNILVPLIENYTYFKEVSKTLYFIKTHAVNKRNPLKVAIYFNRLFHEFYSINLVENEMGYSELKLKLKKEINKPTDKIACRLLKYAFDYFIEHDYINYKDFIKHLLSRNFKLPIQLGKQLDFPFNLLKFNNETRELISIQKDFIIGLSRSIFKLETAQKYRYDKHHKRKSAYVFEQRLKVLKKPINMYQVADFQIEKEGSKVLEVKNITKKHDAFNLNPSKRILITSDSLVNSVLDSEYYRIKANV